MAAGAAVSLSRVETASLTAGVVAAVGAAAAVLGLLALLLGGSGKLAALAAAEAHEKAAFCTAGGEVGVLSAVEAEADDLPASGAADVAGVVEVA